MGQECRRGAILRSQGLSREDPLRVCCQNEAPELPVKGRPRHALEHMSYDYMPERVAKGELLVL